MPPAQPRLSTMIRLPSSVPRRWAMPRAVTSAAPPGGNGTIRRIGLSGKAALARLLSARGLPSGRLFLCIVLVSGNCRDFGIPGGKGQAAELQTRCLVHGVNDLAEPRGTSKAREKTTKPTPLTPTRLSTGALTPRHDKARAPMQTSWYRHRYRQNFLPLPHPSS